MSTIKRTDNEERFAREQRATGATTSPEGPTDLDGAAGRARSSGRSRDSGDNLTDWAAALTYYGVQAIFPALLALVSIVGLVGRSTTDTLSATSRRRRPARPRTSSCRHREPPGQPARPASCSSSASPSRLFSASGYIGAFARASNAIYEVAEGRPIWKLRPQQMGIALCDAPAAGASARFAVVLTGGLAEQVGG